MGKNQVGLYTGQELAKYGFPGGHPFALSRHDAFLEQMNADPALSQLRHYNPVAADAETISLFHTMEYIHFVKQKSDSGYGALDGGDTPVFPGVYEAASFVAGSAMDAVKRIVAGEIKRAFIPIAGLHHARRDRASGFCVFNDCGIVLEYLIGNCNMKKVAYIDIDAHHGDGVYYGFENDERVIFADIHEDGRYLFPGTGFAHEAGLDRAKGTKLNIEMNPGDGDEEFFESWDTVVEFIEKHEPELF